MASASSKHHSHRPLYFKVFGWLAVLTILEIAIPEMGVKGFAKGSSLTILAIAKAFLVAYYFMHLNEEKKWLKFIAAVPIFAVLYTTMVAVESLVR